MTEDDLALLRRRKVGFVFQSYQLLSNMTARENVLLPLELAGHADAGARRATELLAIVGLAERGHHYPAQLSGGEQQRVALARAFGPRPPLLLRRRADREPRQRHRRLDPRRPRPPPERERHDARPRHPRPRRRRPRTVSFGAMAFAPAGATTRLVQVLAVAPGYPYYGTIETSPPGEWSRLAETGGVVADPSLLVSLGARTGDLIALGEARFVLRGTVLNVPGDVGVRSAFGPRVFIPLSRVGETGLLTRGSRGRYEAYLRLPPGADPQRLADRFRPRLSAERVNVRTASEDQRRLGETLSRFGSFLSLVALVALLLGGLGVASAVHVFVRRRLATVAVLRCLGATGGTVLAAYLVQALVVGLLGSLLGAGLGAAAQLALPRLLRDVLPVDVAWSLSWPAVLGGVGTGVWVAVVFSLMPLLAVRRISPLAVLRRDYEGERPRRDPAPLAAGLALAASLVAMAVLQAGRPAHGLAFAAGAGTALAALALCAALLVRSLRRFVPRRLPYLYRQGLANLYRPANQTLMVVLALGFGAFLLSTLLLVQHNLLRELRVDRGAGRPNVVFFDVQPDQREDVLAQVLAAGPLTAPVVPIVPMRILSLKGRAASELLAIEDERQRPERWALRREYRSSHRDLPAPSETLVGGEWWRPGEWTGRTDGAAAPIAMDAGLARELRVGLGDEVVWDVQGVPVPTRVAVLREVEWARFEPNFFVVFPEGPLDGAPRTYVLLSRVEDPLARARLQRAVVEAHPNVSALDLAQVQRAIEGCSTGWSSPCSSWPSSASPRAGSSWPARWRRAATSACARGPCCARSARGGSSW
jgi:putative ABC transport system permease protein